MKTILKVKPNYDSSLAWDMYKESLRTISEDQDIHVVNQNRNFLNVLPTDGNVEDYENQIEIVCRGYVQGEWDTYTIYYHELTDSIKLIAEELKKLFTHQNDYCIQEIEKLDSGHSKVIDTHGLIISDVEFPEKEDIKNAIQDQLNLDYDELIINQ